LTSNSRKLFEPELYQKMPAAEIDEFTGGCGPGKGIGDRLVPDKILCVSIFKACRIHDFMYFFGETIDDKLEADRVFLNNMVRIIRSKSTAFWPLRCLRLRLARRYYQAVKYFGGPAFWG